MTHAVLPEHTFYSNSPAQTINMGRNLGALLQGGDVVLLTGDLGAGKTLFAKGVALGLGISDAITSPTFNLMLEYEVPFEHTGGGRLRPAFLRHFDLYRLEDARALDDIDYFALLEDERAASLVEWGDKFLDALPQQYVQVSLAENAEPACCPPSASPLGQFAGLASPQNPDFVGYKDAGARVLTCVAIGDGVRPEQLLRSFCAPGEV